MDKIKQKVLVISGRKQSGKNTLSNFIEGLTLLEHGIIDHFEVSERTNGDLYIGNDLCSYDQAVDLRLLENVCTAYQADKYIRKYEFADELKLIMIRMFGLTDLQVNGTNGQKDQLTKYVWENMVGLADTEFAERSGAMTVRELMQYVGGNVLRAMHEDIHIEATYRKIQEDGAPLSTIVGSRYPNEILYRPDFPAEVKTIRLARTMYPDDTHSSETSLDHSKFNWQGFDAVIWNQRLTIEETCASVLSWMKIWNWIK